MVFRCAAKAKGSIGSRVENLLSVMFVENEAEGKLDFVHSGGISQRFNKSVEQGRGGFSRYRVSAQTSKKSQRLSTYDDAPMRLRH